jgi:catechol 2,3-dioxygenase-like lactoylglutathione lyase family enzyme
VVTRLGQTIPALPVADAARSVDFYRERMGFEVLHHDGGFAVLRRDDAVIHLWEASDESWRERDSLERPVRSGAESFLAGTASCRLQVGSPEELEERFRQCLDGAALHPVSQGGPESTTFGVRQFHALDRDGNLVTYFVRLPEAA